VSLGPGWVDAIAAAVKTGDEGQAAEALGRVPRKPFRIDYRRRAESQSRGGKKGGKRKKGWRKDA
jgi:hypothetical protein